MRLNPEQTKAVRYIDGPLLVLAGAGSGKTRVITQKIVHLVNTCGYQASKIVAVTFTNKAAREMKERVGQALSKPLRRGLTVSTFHQLGLKIIRSNLSLFGLRKGFSIFDSQDTYALVQKLLPEHAARDKENIERIHAQISTWKSDAVLPQSLISEVRISSSDLEAVRIYQAYQDCLKAYNAVDFDDLILLPLLAFKREEAFKTAWQHKIRYLLVDEYQDTNTCQYELVKALVGPRGAMTVVGDDSQSIYTWRGARPENLHQLKKDFPTLEVVMLEQNYRSSGCILQASNHLISHNNQLYEKKLWSHLGFGDLIRILYLDDELEEAEQVVAEIITHQIHHQTKFSDYAILYRGNHQSRLFEKALQSKGIPYKVSGGQSFFSKTEVKDIFSYIKLLTNFDDDNAFLRVINTPRRGIGVATIKQLSAIAQDSGCSLLHACQLLKTKESLKTKAYEKVYEFYQLMENFSQKISESQHINELLSRFVELIDYQGYLYQSISDPKRVEKKMATIFDFIEWINGLKNRDEPMTLESLVLKLSLIDVMDRGEEESDNEVQLLTLHAAKGLEYPHVFLVGMEEELLPHKTSIEEDNIEEERRLLYVGITRAQKTLTMTLAKKRQRFGEQSDTMPSRFIDELPRDALMMIGDKKKTQTKPDASRHIKGLKALLQE